MAENFKLRVVTPDQIFYEGEAQLLELNTTEGQIGVYKNHVPMVYVAEPGIMTITEKEEKKKAMLHSGFIQILQEEITVLAEEIRWQNEKEHYKENRYSP